MIEPALTPEEWADLRLVPVSNDLIAIRDDGDGLDIAVYPTSADRDLRTNLEAKHTLANWAQNDRRGLAALALYGQPFGFTRRDLELLDEMMYGGVDWSTEEAKSLQRRIESLLPSEKT